MKPRIIHVIVGLMDGGAEGVLARLCIHSQRWIGISALPHKLRYFVSQIIAGLIYWPLARLAVVCEKFGASENFIDSFPLSNYRSLSFYTMRTDALDRFGTRLEQRFTKSQIKNMMESSGLEDVAFSNESIYWLAVGYKESE